VNPTATNTAILGTAIVFFFPFLFIF
jgi:hypothetical protein